MITIHSVFLLATLLCSFVQAGTEGSVPKGNSKPNPSILRYDGDDAFKKREYRSALKSYTQLIQAEPELQINHYKRAMVYFMTNRFHDAVKDLDESVLIDPKYASGYLYRGKSYQSMGELDKAAENYQKVLELEGSSTDLEDRIQRVKQASNDIVALREVQDNCPTALPLLNSILAVATFYVELLVLRVHCYMDLSQYQSALIDAGRVLRVRPQMLEMYLVRGKVLFQLDKLDEAKTQYKNGLKMDPEHKGLKKEFRKLKKMQKLENKADADKKDRNFNDALEGYKATLELVDGQEAISKRLFLKQCQTFVKMKKGAEAVTACKAAVEIDDQFADAWGELGDARILLEEFEEAVRNWDKAVDINPQDGRLRKGSERASRELRKSKQKDYYKILEVPRDANKRTIAKAYRKKARVWHPDRHRNKDDKVIAEKKFHDISDAYEILTNPEKREMFDNGEDPNDPHHGHGGGFPFHQGGGGGFSFSFQGGGFPGGGFPGGGFRYG